MINIDETLFDKRVAVAIEHWLDRKRVFWYYGVLEDVNDTGIILNIKGGIKVIPYKDIRALHEEGKGF